MHEPENDILKTLLGVSIGMVTFAGLWRMWRDTHEDVAYKKQLEQAKIRRAEQHMIAYATFVQSDGTENSSLTPTGFLLN